MESLLANYASDDEEEEPQHRQQQPTRAPFSASLPPPKVEDDRLSDVPSCRSSLFSSLPRPKLESEDTWKSHFRDAEYRDERNALDAAPISGRRYSKVGVRNKELDDDSKVGSGPAGVPDRATKGFNGAQRVATSPFSNGVGGALGTRASLFSALPPPRNAGSSVLPPTSQKVSSSSSKRVVELRPSINLALLQDDEDDVKPPVKRHATEGSKVTGLAAILPKPKNLGSALGSGSASGHQATLDLGSPATSLRSESTLGSGYASGHQHATLDVGASGSSLPPGIEVTSSLESTPHSVYEFSTMSHQQSSESWASRADFGGSHESTFGSWEGHHLGANLQDQPEAFHLNAALSAPYMSTAAQEGAEVYYTEDYYSAPEAYSQEMVAHETSAQDALAEMLRREKRKGGRNAPVNVIEVKQADLTSTKLREDQLKTTGIAFGPAYRPMSAGKNKPTKLHRRKHQIGSLYFDMKQKEMELMERRAKGHMTKAETQAKYGW